jgi:hypothetical protein
MPNKVSVFYKQKAALIERLLCFKFYGLIIKVKMVLPSLQQRLTVRQG